MNKILALFLSLCAFKAVCVIPSADMILARVVEKNPLKNIKPVQFSAEITTDQDKQTKTLELNNLGLSLGKEAIKLYALDILLKSKSSAALKSYLAANNIDLSVVSLGFFGNEPAYIIGAQPDDARSAQLWVEKTNWIIVKEATKNYEIIFDKYNLNFPRAISIKTTKTNKNYILN